MGILLLKCFYQTVQTRISILFFKLFTKECNQIDLVRKRVDSKFFQFLPNKETKVFAIFSMNNWEKVLLKPLASLGELYHFNWHNGKDFFKEKESWSEFRDQLNERLVTEFENYHEKNKNMIVFLYASDFSISESSMRLFNKPNVLVISFCWDDLLYFKGTVNGQKVGVHDLSKYVDINLTLSPEAIPRYNFFQSPCYFWKSLETRSSNMNQLFLSSGKNDFYVLFIGSKYGWRNSFINSIREAGFSVRCYGKGWENGDLPEEEMKEAIRKAPVTLGFSNVGYTKNVTTIKGRDFEVPLFGGLYLTQFSKGLSEYYKIGEEIFVYKNLEGCIKQLKFIKDNIEISNEVRNAGYRKASVFGTWNSRFSYLNQFIHESVYAQQKI